MKKLLAIVLAVCLSALCCACSSLDSDNNGAQSSTSSVTSVGGAEQEGSATGADATLTVKIKSGEIDVFKSDRPYDKNKKDISLILVTGQSNFTTSVGFGGEFQYYLDGKTSVIPEEPTLPEAGTVYSGSTVTELTDARDVSNLANSANMTSAMGGVSPSFGKKWHELTGTTVVFVQAAVGAVGVHEWVPDTSVYECECGHENQLYSRAVAAYKTSYEALSKKYNIVYTGYIWNQGEHDEVFGNSTEYPKTTINSDKAYYEAYKSMHEGFMSELDLDFGGISVVRADKENAYASGSMSLTIARNAQYKLCNDIDSLYMLSTISETCDHSMMDQSNTIHYAQKTFNLMGADMATNLYSYLGLGNVNEFTGASVYGPKGDLIVEFDKDGNALGETVQGKGILGDHILAKVSTLGNNYTVFGFEFKAGEVDLSDCIDEFGLINWSTVATKGLSVKKVQINCVVE